MPEREVSRKFYLCAVGLLLTVLFLARWVASAFGYEVFFFTDAKIQFVWGTIAQFVLGVPLITGAWQALRSRSFSLDLPVVAGTLVAYGYSVLVTFQGASGDQIVLYDLTTTVITLTLIGRLILAARQEG